MYPRLASPAALWFALACAPGVFAASFHVSSVSGDDGNTGGLSDPFASVGHAFAQAGNGDTILLERGSVFRESNLSPPTGATVTDYGAPGEPAPALLGSVAPSGWTPWAQNPNVYQVTLPGLSGPVRNVYVNGERATLARYPDTGWLFTDNENAHVIIDAELAEHPEAAPDRWNGAKVRWRRWSWWYETRTIADDDGAGRLDLVVEFPGPGQIDPFSGFYIDDTLAELDAENEWYWDAATDTLYFYAPGGVDPSTLAVEAAVEERALNVGGNQTIENLAIRYYTDRAINVGGTATVEGCLIEGMANNGIMASWGAGDSQIRDNTIRDVDGVAITWNEDPSGGTSTVIEGNRIERAGTVPGQGGSGVWEAGGIFITNGDGTLLRHNRIVGTGYAGIIFNSNGLIAERNVLIDTMSTLNDGAAIYCNAGENTVRENIILSTQGDQVSNQPWTPLSHGIWIEFLQEFRDSTITGNTVHGSGCHGMYFDNNFDSVVSDNTFFSNRNRGLHLAGDTPDPQDGLLDQGHTISNNRFIIGAVGWQGEDPYEVLREWPEIHLACLSYNGSGSGMDFGTMSGSTFVYPPGTNPVWTSDGGWAFRSISQWQNEQASWADPSPTVITGDAFLFANDTDAPATFTLPAGITWQSLDGAGAGSTVTVQPYRSEVLLAASGDISGLPDLFLASEIPVAAQTAGQTIVAADQPVVSHFFTHFQNDTDNRVEYPLDPADNWRLPDGTPAGGFIELRPRHSRFLIGEAGVPTFIFVSNFDFNQSYGEWITGFGLPAGDRDLTDDPSGNGLPNAIQYFHGIDADSTELPAFSFARQSAADEWAVRFPRFKFDVNTGYRVWLLENPGAPPFGWTELTSFSETTTPDPENGFREWVDVTFTSTAGAALVKIEPAVSN